VPARSGRTAHIAWQSHGDAPGILLLHGFSDSARCWDPLVGNFGSDVLAIDARGHGESALPDESVGSDRQSSDAASVLEDLQTGPVVVVGHSMGASTAASLGRNRPDLVKALILEDPPQGGRAGQEAGRPFPEWLSEIRKLDVAAGIARGHADNPAWPQDELEQWVISKHQLSERIFAVPSDPSPPLTDVLAEVSCPVLLLHGDPDKGGIISTEYAAECVRESTGPLTAVHIEGVGHNVRREARDRYLAAVAEFLASSLSP
jgi:pimeloyl-ACP methyl ester carboxylesterase